MNAYGTVRAKNFGWQNSAPDHGPVGEDQKPAAFDFGA
jgi:hypothetical protein